MLVVTSDYVDFVLDEVGLVGYASLVHLLKGLPGLRVHVEQLDIAFTVGILTAYDYNFTIRDSES